MAAPAAKLLSDHLADQLTSVYTQLDRPELLELSEQLVSIMDVPSLEYHKPSHNYWDQSDSVLITYGDSLLESHEKPLRTLKKFLDNKIRSVINSVHILPFYPFTSDDGFSVMDYSSVNQSLGDWRDINHIAADYKLMADLVINHCSARSRWFENFIAGRHPGADYFIVSDPHADLSAVARPRADPLLKPVETAAGTQHLWCTFSHDQVDLNFKNPAVLLKFVKIIKLYLARGVRIFRLDAVAYLWKQANTSCINLPQTHSIVRVLRALVESAQADAIIITETNIPNRENIAYFGNTDEAHWVYNFSLPPLLVNTLLTGHCGYLKRWMRSMPPASTGTAYFNFIASHDGIGLRPAEGLLDDSEITQLTDCMQAFGGQLSWRRQTDGSYKAYEINISLLDALQGTLEGGDDFGVQRFVCAHAVMFGLEGIPAIYIHSLTGTRNDYERMENSAHNRAINRHQWDYQECMARLENPSSPEFKIYQSLTSLLTIRCQQPAFHPNATQFTLDLGDQLLGYWRQSIDREQSIFCVSNISISPQSLSLGDINLIDNQSWHDLITGTVTSPDTQVLMMAPYQTVWISNTGIQ